MQLLSSLLLLLASATVASAADTDGDGIDDSFDNCAQHANPVQLDADGDGYGNRCDVDFDQSGIANGRDVRLFTRALRKHDPVADIDESGVVDANDALVAIPLWGMPPGPGASGGDDDGDGVPLVDDACPDSQLQPALARGCSAVELALAAPEAIAEPTVLLLRNSVRELQAPPEYDGFLSGLDLGVRSLEDAARTTAQGDACAGADLGEIATRVLRGLSSDLDALLLDSKIAAVRNHPVPPGSAEWSDVEEALFHLLLMQSLFEHGKASADQALADIQSICNDITGPIQLQGIIASVDLARGLAVLESGQVLALAEGYSLVPDSNGLEWEIAPGVVVEAQGQVFRNGAVMAAVISPGQDFPLVQFADRLCLRTQVRPLQLSPVYTGAPWILHNAFSYQTSDGGKLLLEQGTGIGVDTSGCPTDVVGGRRSIYGARVTLRIPGGSSLVLANFLKHGDSVGIPDVFLGTDFEIDVATRRMECAVVPPYGCSQTATVTSQTWRALMIEPGTYCTADYSHTEFDVQTYGGFRQNWVSNVTNSAGPPATDPNSRFSALGYPVLPNGSMSSQIGVIGEGDAFAIVADDFRDLHEANGTSLDEIVELTGTDLPSGLAWPRVQGDDYRGGQYWYSCTLPRITRDVITYCPDFPNTYFTSPLLGVSHIIQGAFSPNPPHESHNNAYAWDFTASLFTGVYAARGGRVKLAFTGLDENCPDGGCVGNMVLVEHQDGTTANYLHFSKDTIDLPPGFTPKVERGRFLGESGNTGVSQGPHLHFGHEFAGVLLDESDDVPSPARFHVNLDIGTFQVPVSCYEPQEHDNVAPYDP